MRLSFLITIALLSACVIAHPEANHEDFSVVQKEWSEKDGIAIQVEENPRDDQSGDDDEDEPKRTKQRSGAKRRRRMRKRYRTTTESPSPYSGDELDKELSVEIQNHEESLLRIQKEQSPIVNDSEGQSTAEDMPRRRPGKRRRRPHRKQQPTAELDDSSSTQDTPKPPKRRRKGGRRRVQPKDTTEVNQQDETTATTTSTTTTTTTTSTTAAPTIVIRNNSYQKKNISTAQSLNEIKSTVSIKTTTPETMPAKETSDDKAFGNKILDRKSLFSKPRRLPETSAILRRKLGPRENLTNDIHLRIIKPLSNLESELDIKENPARNEVKNANETSVAQILQEKQNRTRQSYNKSPTKKSTSTTEEPNYPKVTVEAFTESTPETTTFISVRVVTSTQVSKRIIEEPQVTTRAPEPISVKPNLTDDLFRNINFTNINDSIIELLKTENISIILKARNMTLPQLLDHRERGSSSFHLSDIFQKSTSESTNTRENSSSQINFPEEDVLGSFNKFLSDQIQQNAQVKKDKKTSGKDPNDKREPRLFESMPDFTSSSPGTLSSMEPQTTARIEAVPGWRVIPNPKLKPVSTRGNYKEIRISHVTSEMPNFVDDVDNIYLLNEKNEISHKSKRGNRNHFTVDNHIGSDGKKSGIQRIPVAVKSAIIISGAILALAIFGFLSVLVSCRVRQKKRRLRAKQNILCEHMHNEDITTSQQSLSPVLTKHSTRSGGPVLRQATHSHPDATASHRHYYLWRTIRKTFRYD